MWSFKKKNKPVRIEEFKCPQKLPAWKEDWERILVRFPIGSEFNFCGRKMIVAKRDAYFWTHGFSDPLLCAYYLDNNGVIQEFAFSPKFFQLLFKIEPIAKPEVPASASSAKSAD